MHKTKISKKDEESLAKKVGGKRNLRSGGLWFSKGDVISPDYLFESKITFETTFCLEKVIIDKITTQALRYLKTPVVVVTLNPPKKISYSVVIINKKHCIGLENYKCLDIIQYNKSFNLTYDLISNLVENSNSFLTLQTAEKDEYIILLLENFLELANGTET